MHKKHKIKLAVFVITVLGVILVSTSYLYSPHLLHSPFKVIDPADPRFDPMQFRFEDYNSAEEIEVVLKYILFSDRSVEYVDKILIEVGGATLGSFRDHPEDRRVYTKKRRPYLGFGCVWIIGAKLDENQNINDIGLGRDCGPIAMSMITARGLK